MKGAPCPHCGQQAMPYRRYAFHMSSHATCASCGSRVRIRHFRTAVVGSVIALAAIIAWLIMNPDATFGNMTAILAITGGIAVAVDIAMWRWVGFEAAGSQSSSAHPSAGPAS